jgi:pyruvate dehydrogenase E1 component alpha subunit
MERRAMTEERTQREMLQTMTRIREFESTARDLFADGEIPGFLHLYIGEEAIATGVCQALSADDYITSTHRGHGHCLARGLDPEPMMAELYGKATGYCDGKGGSMHIADVDSGMLGANGIVGAGIPIAGGAALSSSMSGCDHVAVAFFGDGALSQGAFHETMNYAAIHDLPLIGVIENNQYGEMSGLEEHHPESSLDDLTVFGEPYGVTREQVDGMDPEAVYGAASAAVERARGGDGPTLIECITYRFEGHHEGDTEFYRDGDEIDEWRARDPLVTYPEKLIEAGVVTEAEYEEMESAVEAEIREAVTYARESPLPEPETAYRGLYEEGA